VQVEDRLSVATVVEESGAPPPPVTAATVEEEQTVAETITPKRYWSHRSGLAWVA
jgi:hypothetical protein